MLIFNQKNERTLVSALTYPTRPRRGHRKSKSHNSHNFCRIKMAVRYAHLHVTTNNPTKYKWNPSSGFRGVAVTRLWWWTESQSPITPTIFVESKWRLSMHIYMSPQTILLNMNEIRQAVSEELRSQDSDDGRTDVMTDSWDICPEGLTDGQTRWLLYSPLSKEWGYSFKAHLEVSLENWNIWKLSVGSINRKWISDKPEKGRHGTTHRVEDVYKIWNHSLR